MTATWRQIAVKDVQDAARSKLLWGIGAAFVVFLSLFFVVAGATAPTEPTATMALSFVAITSQLFIPLVALVAGYMAVVGERRSGSLRVLLSYPFSRLDVVVGKVIGRGVVIGMTLVVALVVGGIVATALYGSPGVGTFVGYLATVVLFGLTFAGIAVGISAGTASRGRAMGLAIGSYMWFLLFWRPVVAGLYYVLNGSLPGLVVEPWYFLARRLNPVEAFQVLESSVLDAHVGAAFGFPVEDVPSDATPEQLALANRLAGDVPFYLEDWFAVVILLAWLTVPVAIGYLRFRGADLG